MSEAKEPLWATGPGEILRHGVKLLEDDSESNRRIALISIDNAVELMMQTYITLPERITGVSLPRKTRDDFCKNFPSLLDGIEQHASSKIVGLDLGEIEWFHRQRNNLYHQGNGLSVPRSQVEIYAEIAQKLFSSLFSVELTINDTANMHKFGVFIDAWISIEKSMAAFSGETTHPQPARMISKLFEEKRITFDQAQQLDELRILRNQLIHGKIEPESALTKEVLESAKRTAELMAAQT